MSDAGPIWNGYLSFNSVDLSSKVRSVTLNTDVDQQDASHWGVASKLGAPGLVANSISVEFNQDFAASGAGSVDATLGVAALARTTAALELRLPTDTVGTTNPKWTATAFVAQYSPIPGVGVGQQATATATFALTTALTRATT